VINIPCRSVLTLYAVPERMPRWVPSTFTSAGITMIFLFGFRSGIRVSAVSVLRVLAGRWGTCGALATRICPVSMSASRKDAPGMAGGRGIPGSRFTMTPDAASC